MREGRSKGHPEGKNPWSVPIAVADVPEIGRQVEISADASARAEIAKIANVLAVHQLNATFELARHGSDGLRVVGKIGATLEQQCVLTLEPMQSNVEETIDLVFSPRALSQGEDTAQAEHEPAEILQDGVVDLGAIATEFLLLGIDPYPRKPGAVFAAPAENESTRNRPFAALAALKKGLRGPDR
jgi:uncharacterized metal-binding protein YceD (DUF177 family)